MVYLQDRGKLVVGVCVVRSQGKEMVEVFALALKADKLLCIAACLNLSESHIRDTPKPFMN